MSIDILQEKIRKLKNPSVIDFGMPDIPPHILAEEPDEAAAYQRYCLELLAGLKETVPAVRFHFNAFALMGAGGLDRMAQVLASAGSMGFYVFLDAPGVGSPAEAEMAAQRFLGKDSPWRCDGILVQPYLGTDCVKPFLRLGLAEKKTVFLLARSANRSASEIQDLLTGTRVVHHVVVESVKLLGSSAIGRCHYNEVGAVISATKGQGIRNLRSSFPEVFFLMDGLDYVGGNASNCSAGFDRVGHGAAACAGSSVIGAWVSAGSDGRDYVELAAAAAERMKKNLTRYTTVL